MSMKFVLQEDPIRVNTYRLSVVGLPEITFVTIGALEREIDKVDLPDRTQVSGGRTKAGDTEVSVPAHHLGEIAAMDAWRAEAVDPISPTYKKVATLTISSGTGINSINRTMIGAWINKDGLPDVDMKEDGEMAVVKYTICWDDII